MRSLARGTVLVAPCKDDEEDDNDDGDGGRNRVLQNLKRITSNEKDWAKYQTETKKIMWTTRHLKSACLGSLLRN